jgi:hypothetical protein
MNEKIFVFQMEPRDRYFLMGRRKFFFFLEGIHIREETSGKKEITGILSFVLGTSCLSSKGDLKCGVK